MKKKGRGCLIAGFVAGGVVLLIVILIAIGVATQGGGGSSAPSAVPAQSSEPPAASSAPPASEPPASEPPAPDNPKVGDPFPFEGRQGKGTITVESAKWKKNGLVEPESGNYLVLDVVVKGEEGTVSYNPLYFSVQDEDGREYNIAFGADAEPSLKSGKLEAGKKARGYISFDVKKGPVTLSVTDELLQQVASIDIPG